MTSSLSRKILLNVFQHNTKIYFKENLLRNQKIVGVSKRYAKTEPTNICWKCGIVKSEKTQFFCEKCNSIQLPKECTNYFKIFELEEKFRVDEKALRDRYRRLQSVLHPDKFSNKSEDEKNISAEYSSLVNKAYNNLQVPLKRAEYLLNLKGESIGESQSVDDPEFLMEMMELNEEVENTKDGEKLKELNLKNKNELEKIAVEIDKCFQSNDVKKAKECIVKMKYYASLGNRINSILRESGIMD